MTLTSNEEKAYRHMQTESVPEQRTARPGLPDQGFVPLASSTSPSLLHINFILQLKYIGLQSSGLPSVHTEIDGQGFYCAQDPIFAIDGYTKNVRMDVGAPQAVPGHVHPVGQ